MNIKIILTAVIGLLLTSSSCKRCYQCTIKYEQTTTPTTIGMNSSSTTTTEFCGTLKEKEAYVASGTTNTTSSSGNISVRVKTTTTCLQ